MADTTLTLRLTKGSQLTAQELDDNFTALDSSIDSAAGSLLPNNNTWTGANTFNNTITGSITGNAATATTATTATNATNATNASVMLHGAVQP